MKRVDFIRTSITNYAKAAAIVAVASLTMTSCSDDDDPTDPNVKLVTIDFENTSGVIVAGPTSYGANLYDGYTGGAQFESASYKLTNTSDFVFGVNDEGWYDKTTTFYNGGMVVSNWNYRSNQNESQSDEWWMSYENQCSVYNTKSTDGANKGAGANGSNYFAVINGVKPLTAPYFTFSGNAEFEVRTMEVCPTSYLYGVVVNGNVFDATQATDLISKKGWMKIQAYGYDAEGNETNGGQPVEMYICDYRDNASPKVEIASTWKTWTGLEALGRVNRVEFSFVGSDNNAYGLLTPTYMAIDNIVINVAPENKI